MDDAIVWELYGTRKKTDKKAWHPLKSEIEKPGQLTLRKTWPGSVDETDAPGEKSRWLRVRYKEAINTSAVTGTRTRSITIRVKTVSDENTQQQTDITGMDSDCGEAGTNTENGTIGKASDEESSVIEGSHTIDQAFHSGNPLPLTTRFLPFGPEPQRFDTFALAAPEAFSKKGAKVTLAITLVDASVASFDMALRTNGPMRGYAISQVGRLQLITLEGEEIHWQEFTHPSELPQTESPVASDDMRSLRLDSTVIPQSVQLHTKSVKSRDLIVVRDLGNRLWATTVIASDQTVKEFEQLEWRNLPPVPGSIRGHDLVLIRIPTNQAESSQKGFVITAGDDDLYRLALSDEGIPIGEWVKMTSNSYAPKLGKDSHIVPELDPDWPKPPDKFPVGIVVLDDEGQLWRGEIRKETTVNWERFANMPQANNSVRPVAAKYRQDDEDRTVIFATKHSDRQLFAVREVNGLLEYVEAPVSFIVKPGTTLRCNPGLLDADAQQPVAIAFGDDPLQMALWTHDDRLEPAKIPTESMLGAVPDALLLPSAEGFPRLILAGTRESLYTSRLIRPIQHVETERFDTVILDNGGESAHYLELDSNGSASRVFKLRHNPAIEEGDVRAYPVPPSEDVSEGDTYRFFRRKSSSAVDLEGSAVSNKPEKLRLADEDDTTSEGDTLIIGDRAHGIVSISDRVATLDPPLPSMIDRVNYTPTSVRFKGHVEKKHLSTLLRLTDVETRPRRTALRFAAPASPTEQPIYLADERPDGVWVLLANGWTAEPDKNVAELLLDLDTGEWSSQRFQRSYENPELSWEYYDGDAWRRIEDDFVDTTHHLLTSGDVIFTVPDNLSPAEIAGQKDYWVRARLVGGDYGRAKYIVTSIDDGSGKITQTVTVDTSDLLPPEIIRIEAYFDAAEGQPQHLLIQNNLDIRNQTQANKVPDAEFELFEGVRKINGEKGAQRALYFGFNQRFDVSRLSMFVDAVDQERNVELDFEVLAQDDWRRVSTEDETRGFHRRGFVKISVDVVPRKARLFGRDLHWLRVRPRRSLENWAPRLRGVFINAVRAEQAKTIKQELLGSSQGESGMRFTLSNRPVLPDSLELRVRETLSDEEHKALNANVKNLPEEKQRVERYGDLSLNGDWVFWERVDSFIGQGPNDRVYRLDSNKGVVSFGDDRQGRIPPAGSDSIRAIRYQTGGGTEGNVDPFTIQTLKSAVEAVEKVANPIAAAGGTATPSIDKQIVSAPARLRYGRHALTPPDIEALALSTSPDLVQARCLFPDSPGAPIRVAISLRTGERCPRPSLAHRQALANTIRKRAWGALDEEELKVIAPEYLCTRLQVWLRATSTDKAAALEQAATVRLRLLMHPVDGGPTGNGWPFGQRIWESDVFRALTELPGFDRVEDIELTPVDRNQEFERMSPLALICAEEADVQAMVELGNGGI